MKYICTLMLSGFTAVSALADDSEGRLRERTILCNQFVIEEPANALIPDTARHCCRMANWIHDCRAFDWDEQYR